MTTIEEAAFAAERNALNLSVETLTGERDQLQTTVRSLTDERDLLAQRVRTLQAEVQNVNQRLSTVAQMLLDEAQRRDWCSEYDRFVDDVNRTVGTDILMKCARDFQVDFSGHMTVNARSEDDAAEMVSQMMGRLESRSDYSMSWDIGDVEPTE